jgi:hypothetical protein
MTTPSGRALVAPLGALHEDVVGRVDQELIGTEALAREPHLPAALAATGEARGGERRAVAAHLGLARGDHLTPGREADEGAVVLAEAASEMSLPGVDGDAAEQRDGEHDGLDAMAAHRLVSVAALR